MKATILLPDKLVTQADQHGEKLGMSRYELLLTALQRFYMTPQACDLIDRINAICITLDTALPEDIAAKARQKFLEVEW